MEKLIKIIKLLNKIFSKIKILFRKKCFGFFFLEKYNMNVKYFENIFLTK